LSKHYLSTSIKCVSGAGRRTRSDLAAIQNSSPRPSIMGQCCAKQPQHINKADSTAAAATNNIHTHNEVKSGESGSTAASSEPKKLDPKDFVIMNRSGEVILREPGKIDGQQFVIDGCKGCKFYLFDWSAAITIDECEDCDFFLGPCESSVFIRTTKNSRFILAAQQLRTRDCTDLDLLIYISAGQPVIENSSNIRFGCFNYNYFGLEKQFLAAKLPLFNSEWSNVHDFHDKQGEIHYTYLPVAQNSPNLIDNSGNSSSVQPIEGWTTPVTYGNREHSKTNSILAIFPQQSATESSQSLYDFITKLQQLYPPTDSTPESIKIIRSRCMKLNPGLISNVFRQNSAAASNLSKNCVVGVEINGENSSEIINKLIQENNWQQILLETDSHALGAFFEPIQV
jgi:protein XRP2